MSNITFHSRHKKGFLGTYTDETLHERLEGKIVIKAWKEIEKNFPYCVLSEYLLRPDSFSGILMIDNSQVLDNPRKFIPKVLASFKNRSTVLLNQFHGTHGRVFWKNNYDESHIEDINDLREVLIQLKVNYQQ
jgi:hypothetical protein